MLYTAESRWCLIILYRWQPFVFGVITKAARCSNMMKITNENNALNLCQEVSNDIDQA